MSSVIDYVSSRTAERDPISDVIGLVRPRVVGGCLHAAGAWAVRYEAFSHLRFGNVVKGEAWLSIEGREPVLLREGDFYLLGHPPAYTLGSAPTVRPRAAKNVILPDGSIRLNITRKEDTFMCGGSLLLESPSANVLLDVLPVFVIVRANDPRQKLFASISTLLAQEIGSPSVGGSLVIDRMGQVLLVHMLRAHAEQPERPAGWLGALRDDQIGTALRAMHADMARRWTLDELAKLARMSRSAFAAAFKKQVGTAPLEYLIQWRMAVARDSLRRNVLTIAELTTLTGYESQSAFSTAFRRVVGTSPRHFRESTALT